MIQLRNVSKTVQSGDHPLTILHPLDYTIQSGQFVAIVGPSGSGKSTLLGLLAGLDAPTTGQILIDGVDITTLTEDGLARLRGEKIGFVFQFFHLVPSLTAFENVLIPMEIAGRRDATARARQLVEEVGLSDRAHHYPSQLSGGEQQRIAIARALANDPDVLLMDEPFGALDAQTRIIMQELLVGLWQRTPKTIIFVTHDIDEAIFLSQRVYIMTARPGRIKQTLDVTLPRPRSLDVITALAFTDMKRAVLTSIKEEGLKAISMVEPSA